MSGFEISYRNTEFEKLREENFAYVDKTKMVYHLVDEEQYYFLSRPRHLGKYKQVERPMSYGRIDAVIQNDDYIYII